MAKLALTVVGAGIGFMIGGPMGAQIGAMAGGLIGNALFAPTIKGPRMTDLSITASTYGNTIPELYGTMRMSGNVIWSSGIKEKENKSGGKGGPKQVTYTYSASFAIAFAKGTVDNMTRIWADGKLIAGSDPATTAGTGPILALAGILNLTKDKKGKFKYRFYKGDEEQLPDSTIVADKGEGNVPAYRGLSYLVFIDMPLEDFGNRIPQITAELTRMPVIAAPYVDLSTQGTDGTYTPTPSGGQWASRGDADWSNNQFNKYISDGTGNWFVHYDMRTMQELYRVSLTPGYSTVAFTDPHSQGPQTALPSFNPAFSIGGSYFFANTSLGNSGSAHIWNATTGECLGRIGHYANAFPADPLPDSSQPFYPEGALIGTWDAQAMWFRTLNETGQSDYVYHAGNLGTRAVIWTPGLRPAHYIDFGGGSNFFGAAFSWTPMRGAERPPTETQIGNSDVLFFHNGYDNVVGWDVHLKIVTMFDGTAMILSDGPPYTASNFPSNTEIDIKLPRPFAGEDFRATNFAYDKSDNGIVMWGDTGANNLGNFGTWRFCKYLIDEGVYKWAWKDTDLDPSLAIGGTGGYSAAASVGTPTDSATQSNLDGGTVGWMRGTMLYTNPAIYEADLQTGRIVLAGVASPLPNYTEGSWAMNAWDDTTESVMGAPTRVFVTTVGDGVPLQAIVDDVLSKTGPLEPGLDWDSSALSGIYVHGYSISRDTTARDVLQQLAGAYFFDGVESDYIIKMNLRGGDSIATIAEKHLSWVEDRDNSLKETRTQEIELPMRVTVNYSDTDRDYQEGSQSAKRNTNPFPTMHSHLEAKIDFPIAMKATDAKRIADKTLKMAWSNRWSYKMKMPWEHIKYDPTDIIDIVTDSGTSYKMRLSKMTLGVDFNVEVEGTSEKPAAYTSVAVGDPGSGVPPQVINLGGPVNLYILNTPLLRDMDDTQGVASIYYAAATPKSPGTFKGAYLFESTDATGLEYADKDALPTEPTWGMVSNALPKTAHYGLDTTTVLTVRIMSVDSSFNPTTLSSCTYDELLAGKNAAIVGDEIIQFMTAQVQADGQTYKLSNLLRARRGTNYAVPYHKAGERFILLDATSLVKEANPPASWENKHYYKGVAAGQYEEDVTPVVMNMEPNDLKPYSPECVKCSDDGTTVTMTFQRRSRITSELHDSDGNVTYREGQGALAHFVYKIYTNTNLAAELWTSDFNAAAFTGQVPIYSGINFANLTFNFPVAGVTEFVAVIYEVGYVDGFPKIVHFKKVGPDWDMTELY